MSEKKRYTATSRHFSKTPPSRTSFLPVQSGDFPPGRMPTGRLGFGGLTEKLEFSCGALADFFATGCNPNVMLFPDTGFITTKLDERVWHAAGERTVVLIPAVVDEIQGWLANPYQNKFLAGVIRRVLDLRTNPVHPDEAFLKRAAHRVLEPADWLPHSFVVNPGVPERLRQHGYQHYVTRLTLRKLVGVRVARDMEAGIGRPVSEQELDRELQRRLGPRNSQIALKGWKDFGKPNYTADEELVVTAVLTAILTGCETVLLSWDRDIQEQFVRLAFMVLGDYHAHLLGEAAADPAAGIPLARQNIPPTAVNSPFDGDHVHYVALPDSEVGKLPPPEFHPVHVHCYVLGNHQADLKVTPTWFTAETGMRRVLDVVGETGRTTRRFGDRNIHTGSMDADGEAVSYYVIGRDKMVEFEGHHVPAFEIQKAQAVGETYRRVWFFPADLGGQPEPDGQAT